MPSDNSVYFKRNSTGRKMADKQILCIMNLPLFVLRLHLTQKWIIQIQSINSQ